MFNVVVLAYKINWDGLVNIYEKQVNNGSTVAVANRVNPRGVIAAMVIKYMFALSDHETLQQIQEIMYKE